MTLARRLAVAVGFAIYTVMVVCMAVIILLGVFGCSPVIPYGVYRVPAHTLVLAPSDTVNAVWHQRGGKKGITVYGFWDVSVDEVWCSAERVGQCYPHELKHMLKLWTDEHEIR